jgi:hypothetical protein
MLKLMLLTAALSNLSADPPEKGFVPMFNGRDLSGWVNVNCAPNTFTTRDGMVITTGIPTGVMRTKRMYENFIVEFDWMHMKKGGNSGFFIHSGDITVRGQPFTKAFEIQVLDGDDPKGLWTGQGDVFSIHGASFVPDRPHPAGWERCLPSERRANSYGHWNHYRVESRDGRITLAVNGKVVSGGSKCNPRKGYICLESEGSECHFKNMRIKELPSSNPPQSETAQSNQGFVSLYNGLNLAGWKTIGGNAANWQAKDWILNYDAKAESPIGEIQTDKMFGDYVLLVDWRLDPKSALANDKGGGEILLRDSACRVAILAQPRGSGGVVSSASLVPPAGIADGQAGEWNRFEITLKGNRISVALNGSTVVKEAVLTAIPERGFVGIKSNGTSIQFANIYIRPL